MNTAKKQFQRQALRIVTCSALAAVIALAPNLYSQEGGFLSYPAAHAESSCFIAGTQIVMADGSSKPIEALGFGDYVIGHNGMLNRVIGIERVPLGGRRLYSFNQGSHFVTAEHPFMTTAGWKSINPAQTQRENPLLQPGQLGLNDRLSRFKQLNQVSDQQGNLAVEPHAEAEFEFVRLRLIDSIEADPELRVYNLLLDGNHSYIADGYLVHNKGGDGGGESGGGESGGSESGGSESGDGESGGSESGGSESGDGESDNSGSGSNGDESHDGNSGDDGDSNNSGHGRGDDGDGHNSGHSSNDDAGSRDHRSSDDSEHGDKGRGRDGDGHSGRGLGRGEHDFQGQFDDSDNRLGEPGREHSRDEDADGHRSSGDHSTQQTGANRSGAAGFASGGPDLSQEQEAEAMANGWK